MFTSQPHESSPLIINLSWQKKCSKCNADMYSMLLEHELCGDISVAVNGNSQSAQ